MNKELEFAKTLQDVVNQAKDNGNCITRDEVEEAFEKQHFVRCSKSVVINLLLLDSISPALNGRFFAHMKNGEKLMISRQYAPKLKQIVMGGNKDEK